MKWYIDECDKMKKDFEYHPIINSALFDGMNEKDIDTTKQILDRIYTSQMHSKFQFMCFNHLCNMIAIGNEKRYSNISSSHFHNIKWIMSELDYQSRKKENSIFIGNAQYKKCKFALRDMKMTKKYTMKIRKNNVRVFRFRFSAYSAFNNIFVVKDDKTQRSYIIYNNVNCVSFTDVVSKSYNQVLRLTRQASSCVTIFENSNHAIVHHLFGFKNALIPHYMIPFEYLFDKIVKGEEITFSHINDVFKTHIYEVKCKNTKHFISEMNNSMNFIKRCRLFLDFLITYRVNEMSKNCAPDGAIQLMKSYTSNIATMILKI